MRALPAAERHFRVSRQPRKGRAMKYGGSSGSLATPMPHEKWIADIPASRLYELLLWLAFVGAMVPDSEVLMAPGAKRILLYSSLLSGILFIALSVRHIRNIGEYIRLNQGYWLLLSIILVCFCGTCAGILIGGPRVFKDLCIHSLVPYGAAVLMLAPADKNTRDRLVVTFKRQIFVAAVFGVFAIRHTQMAGMFNVFDRQTWYESYEKSAYIMLCALPFLAGYAVGKRNLRTVLLLAFAYLMFIVLSLRGANRASLVIAFLVIPSCVLAIYWKRNGFARVSVFMAKSLLVISLFFALVRIAAPSLISELRLDASAAYSIFRFTQSYDVSSTKDVKAGVKKSVAKEARISRGAEARDFIKSLEFPEHIIGKGFGIMWYSSFWGVYWPIVHVGPLHLVLKGGLILAVTYYLLFFFTVMTSWRHSVSDPVATGCFVYIICWIAQFHLYGAQDPSYNTYVFWLIAGMALSCGMHKKRDVQTRRTRKKSR